MTEPDRVFCTCCALTQLAWEEEVQPEPTKCFLCQPHTRGSTEALVEHEDRLLERIKRLEIATRDYEHVITSAGEALERIAEIHRSCACPESRPCESRRTARQAAKACRKATEVVPGLRPL